MPNGVSDENVRIEARSTLLSTAARLLVHGVPDAVRRHEVVNMAGEAIVLLGASDRYAQALHAVDAWTRAPQTAPFALLDATLALDSDGSWLRQAVPPVAQRLRDAVETFASDTTAAAAYAGDGEDWLQLTGYAGAAAATARTLRCRAVDSLTESGEMLAAAQSPGGRQAAGPGASRKAAGSAGPPRGRRRDAPGGRHGGRRAAQPARRRQVTAGCAAGRRTGAQRPGMARRARHAGPAPARGSAQASDLRRARVPRPSSTPSSDFPRGGRTAAVASALPLVILAGARPGLPPGFP